jgi:hypothetical protein
MICVWFVFGLESAETKKSSLGHKKHNLSFHVIEMLWLVTVIETCEKGFVYKIMCLLSECLACHSVSNFWWCIDLKV